MSSGPAHQDLSFEHLGQPIHFSCTDHGNLELVVFSSLGRIGQVVEVNFPEELVSEALARQGRVEYESRLLLGTDDSEADLFIRRFVKVRQEQLRKRKRLIISFGFDGLSRDVVIAALKQMQPAQNTQILKSYKTSDHRKVMNKIMELEIVRRLSSAATSSQPAVDRKAEIKKSIFLPKTSFPAHVKSTERARMDQELAIIGGIHDLYQWQRSQPWEKTFELLDGPPYANGVPHTGHAINKVLKDFIVKSRIALNEKVTFRPGWDCHGLPIELKITKSVTNKSPVEIRGLAREVAETAIGKQLNAFRRWGVSADWENPYKTMDADYVSEQLRLFGRMIDNGLVYRTFKPVYWSPSSQTALAESELEYNEKHTSTAAWFRFKMIDLSAEDIGLETSLRSKPLLVYALTWTSTPWTLPMNNAVAVSTSAQYVAVQFDDTVRNPVTEVYVLAADRLSTVEKEIGRKMSVVGRINGGALEGKHYRSCWYNELALPVLAADHVTMTMGTGLVHTSFAHGFQDYTVAVANDWPVESYVDELGRYGRQMGHILEGKEVLYQGQKEALTILKKDVVHTAKYVHSYPYDWRTKKPVIIRSSAQWFVNVGEIGVKAVDLIRNITVGQAGVDMSSSLARIVEQRPAWCISRQRVWGVPIPYLIHNDGNSYTSSALADRLADLVKERGTDVWWACSVEDLVTKKVSESFGKHVRMEELRKGEDVMDVWMDSGMAWHCARQGYPAARDPQQPADVVLEGVDQFRGWFQSLLLTAAAVQDTAPYKHVIVHGFCVDEDNKKMSKSQGNVVDPDLVTDGSLHKKALGADGLRLWVALQGSENPAESRIGTNALADVEKKIGLLRNSMRFLLGGCDGYDGRLPAARRILLLDQYILREAVKLSRRSADLFRDVRFRSFVNELVHFTQKTLSTNYVNLVRDRLYCAARGSPEHVCVQYTLHRVGSILASCLAPVLPHLAAEFLSHQPATSEKLILRSGLIEKEQSLDVDFDVDLDDVMREIFLLRTQIVHHTGTDKDSTKIGVELSLGAGSPLLKIQPEDRSFSSELCELLGVSMVVIKNRQAEVSSVQLVESEGKHCERCRRKTRLNGELCERCTLAAPNLNL